VTVFMPTRRSTLVREGTAMSNKREDRDWIDPGTGRPSCPECEAFGYHDDGTPEGRECATCQGYGVATVRAATIYLERTETQDLLST
jgi:hypothetical protein